MKKRLFMLVLLVLTLGMVASAAAQQGQGADQWISFLEHIIAALIVVIPLVSPWLIKISKLMKQSAQFTKEFQDVQLAMSEALADGDVSNEDIRKIMKEGREAKLSAQQTWQMLMDLIEEAHAEIKRGGKS